MNAMATFMFLRILFILFLSPVSDAQEDQWFFIHVGRDFFFQTRRVIGVVQSGSQQKP
jgi:hypothetical protein